MVERTCYIARINGKCRQNGFRSKTYETSCSFQATSKPCFEPALVSRSQTAYFLYFSLPNIKEKSGLECETKPASHFSVIDPFAPYPINFYDNYNDNVFDT